MTNLENTRLRETRPEARGRMLCGPVWNRETHGLCTQLGGSQGLEDGGVGSERERGSGFLWGDGNVWELERGGGCTTL